MSTTITEPLIEETLKYVKDMLNIDLTLCDYFTGIREFQGDKYFNIEVEKKYDDPTINALKRLSKQYGKIKDLQPNGVTRWAIILG